MTGRLLAGIAGIALLAAAGPALADYAKGKTAYEAAGRLARAEYQAVMASAEGFYAGLIR